MAWSLTGVVPFQGTAIVYFKRFYLGRTVMDEEPRVIAATALLLATKSEEAHIRIGDLANATGTTASQLVENEHVLIEGINFHLKVHTPYRAVQGFVNELKHLDKDKAKPLLNGATGLVEQLMFSDAIFLFPPSQIALSCVRGAASNLDLGDVVDRSTRLSLPIRFGYVLIV